MEVNDYIAEEIRNKRKVIIEIKGKVNNDFIQMNWIINGKYILEDMPWEVFEGEELTKMGEKLNE